MSSMDVINKLLLRDARELTEVLPVDNPLVTVTITSPPYWDLKNYGNAKQQIGFGQTKSDYLRDIQRVLRKCWRVTKPTGSLWLVVDDYRDNGVLHLLPWEIAERAKKAGWVLRELIVWDKQHSAPWHMKGQMRNVAEFVLFFTKTDNYKCYTDRIKLIDEISKWWVDFPERFNPKGKTPTNIWSFPVRTQGMWRKRISLLSHHCPFPTKLVSRILEMASDAGDLILDPFAGSGVVLAQAAAMERQFIGFEVNKSYVRMFEKIVKKEVAAEWNEIQRWRNYEHIAKNGFEKTILKLRALKYTRQVTKPFIEKGVATKKNRVKAVLCLAEIPRSFRRDRPFLITIVVAVDEHSTRFNRALRKCIRLSARAPISQYGIRSKIKLVKYSSLKRRKSLRGVQLHLYREYKPHRYVTSGVIQGLNDDISKSSDPRLPLLSNVAVDVSWAVQN
jgi:DNA modification methylase